MAFLSTTHLSHQILLFSSPTVPLPFSQCVQTTSTHTSLLDQPTLVTPVLLSTTSFLTLSISVSPQKFLRHHVFITFNLFREVNTYFILLDMPDWSDTHHIDEGYEDGRGTAG